MASDLTEEVLKYLAGHETVDTLEFASLFNVEHQKVVGTVKSLQSLGNLIQVEELVHRKWELTSEGKMVVEKGSHEALVFNSIPPEGILQSALINGLPSFKVGFSKAMSHGWIKLTKTGKDSLVTQNVNSITDVVQENLKQILVDKSNELNEAQKQDYRKRKLVQELVIKSYLVSRGLDFTTSVQKAETDLTMEMIASGSWKEKNFKPYNFDALGVPPSCGHLHPLLRVRTEFRQIFLEMGFTEMPTNNFVENSFWNFDALFQPQQHPARDAHDTFFVSNPRNSSRFPPEYLQKVKQVHSKGGYGSQGYGYDWKAEEAMKNLLRTHTTAVSARMLYLLAREGFKPSKYFSIDRVFRNETLDATHLAEFHQVEGVIADFNLTLGDLIGTLYEFFKKLGITRLQFKPAYNPYTEPSMEIFCYHVGLGKWIEVGNSGIFRPEMLLPMGLPENVNVIAWGLSLERPTMIKYGFNNIRELVGAKVNLQMVHDSPLCRLDKNSSLGGSSDVQLLEQRWDSILEQLEDLKLQIKELRNCNKILKKEDDEKLPDMVILVDPQHPPYSVFILVKLVAFKYNVNISTHMHSSIDRVPAEFNLILNGPLNYCNTGTALNLTVIWKNVGKNPSLVVSPISHGNIEGEVNIARYFNRLLEQRPEPFLVYESKGEIHSGQVDSWLDFIYKSIIRGSNKMNSAATISLAAVLGKQEWLVGESVTVADICLWSSLRQNTLLTNSNSNLKKWFTKCCQHFGHL